MGNDNKVLSDAIRQRERAYSEAIDRLRELARGGPTADEVYDLTSVLREAIELVRCGRRLTGGRTVREIHDAFGAPGDFGYETPIGDALYRVYSVPSVEPATPPSPPGVGSGRGARWTCSTCGLWNIRERETCLNCGATPTTEGGTTR